MVMRGCVGAVVLIVALAACAATPVAQGPGAEPAEAPSGPAVSWQGHRLREVTSLAALPAPVRRALGADNRGLDGMAGKGEPFNVGDAVVEPLPMRRFITAGHDGDTWLVAFEQGGIVHSVTAVEISGGVMRRGWSLDCCMTTLAEVVRQVSAAPPNAMFVPNP
ncbi:hypothetical protein [Inquilinus limosus]|uniref:hypothetical protein n=1 Tax=Inquilinus limosus TaxID=171674 RepID=UPI00126A38CE|nr:hypothetical protein [Inquilinus limosus]